MSTIVDSRKRRRVSKEDLELFSRDVLRDVARTYDVRRGRNKKETIANILKDARVYVWVEIPYIIPGG